MYAVLGIIAGILAGMLGVGGGIIIVPLLAIAFSYQGFSPDVIMHMAIGTSLASIMFTSLSSAYSHHTRQGVDWNIVKYITPNIIVGTYCGSFFASKIPANYLQMVFALFLFYVSLQMIFDKKPKSTREMPGILGINLVGIGIGAISSLVDIGGGTVSIPFMLWNNFKCLWLKA